MVICEAISQACKHYPGQDYFINLFSVCNRVNSVFLTVSVTELPIVTPYIALLAVYAAHFLPICSGDQNGGFLKSACSNI